MTAPPSQQDLQFGHRRGPVGVLHLDLYAQPVVGCLAAPEQHPVVPPEALGGLPPQDGTYRDVLYMDMRGDEEPGADGSTTL